MNARIQMILINALNAMLPITVRKLLMEIYTDNAYVMMAIMMMEKMIYANYALYFGI